MSDQLQPINEALTRGDKEEARALLEPILADNPTADIYVLAAKAADTTTEAVPFLQKALELDPNHPQAKPLMAALAPSTPVRPSPVNPPVASPKPPSPAAPTPSRQQSREQIEKASAVAVERREGDQRTSVEGVYEMLWDCKYCGTKKNLGKTHQFCPNCGSPQDPSWRYFPADDEKVAVKDHVYVGADVTCPSCGTTSSSAAEFCGRCGTPLKDVAKINAQAVRSGADGQKFSAEDVQARMNAAADAAVGRVAPAAKAKSGGRGGSKWLYIIGGIVVLAVIGVLVATFWTRESSAYVTGYRWERAINVEQLQAIPGSSSCDAVPLGAYSIDRRYEQVGSRSVPDGETCSNQQVDQGDGTFRQERVCETRYRQEPVMGYNCYYVVNTWSSSRTVNADGDKSDDPYWPDTNVSNCSTLGCEREQNNGRSENYLLQLRAGERDFECGVSLIEWEETPLEAAFTIEFGVVLNNPRCESLKPTQ